MSFIDRIFGEKPTPEPLPAPVEKEATPVRKNFGNYGGWSDLSPLSMTSGYHASDTGEIVGPYGAMTVSAVYAAVRALSEDGGLLPFHLYEKLSDGRGSKLVREHPLIDLLDEPNEWQSREEFLTYLLYSLILCGNGYAFIQRDYAGNPIKLIPVDPHGMNVLIDQNGTGEIFYNFTVSVYPTKIFACASEDMIHIKNSITSPNGVMGLSPISLGQQVLGIGMATQRSAATLFANGAQLRGILTKDGVLSEEAWSRLAQSWTEANSGTKNHNKIAILEEGLNFQAISMPADQAELLDSRRFSVEEIARWFRISPVKLMDYAHANFSNIEALDQSYIDDSLQPNLSKIESAFRRKLILGLSDRKKLFFKFDTSAKQKGKDKERMEAAQIGRFTGILTQNEARDMVSDRLNPVPGGDTFLTPMNMNVSGKPQENQNTTINTMPMPSSEPDDADDTQ